MSDEVPREKDDGASPGADSLPAVVITRPKNALAEWVVAHSRIVQPVIWLVIGAAIALGTLAWALSWLDIEDVGYSGTFLVNLVGSAAVIVPVPGLAVTCAGAAEKFGLNPVLLGVLGGTGSTLGELTGYLAGYAGQGLARRSRHYDRIHEAVSRRGGIALFILSVVPNPVFDVAGIAAGSLGYPLRWFLVYVLAGKLIKFVVIALGCRSGIEFISSLF